MESKFTYRNSDGVRRTSIADDATPGVVRVFTEVEMDGVLEGIKRDREALRPGSTNKLLARAPLTVVERSIHEQWDDGDWKKWLNDPDNACFRVWPGRV
jgi:hypothetical protein